MKPSPVSESQVDDEVSRAAFSLLLKEPFYAHVLAGMPREVTERVATAAVSWNGQQVKLLVNPEFFLKALTPNQRVAVLKHEVLHVAFRHLFRQADRDPQIDNLAADLVVNQVVAPWPLPKGAVLLESFPDLKLQPDQTTEQYYASLMKIYREMVRHGFGGKDDSGEGDEGGEGDGDGSTGKGKASAKKKKPATGSKGGSAGLPDWAKKTSAPQSAGAIGSFLGEGGRGDHSVWAAGGDSLATAAGRYAIGSVLIRARERMPAHQWRTLSAAMQSLLAALIEERQPKLDWRRTLRIFCGASGKTRIRHSMKRVSKRYGTRPGIRIQRLQRLLVAVDTSGSIDQTLLEEFFTEIHGVWRAGATVTIIECDAAVKRHYEYRGKMPEGVMGGGGTEFEPVFRWMQEGRSFDGCLYLTDGCGPAPTTRPNCRLLWVLPGGGDSTAESDLPFGATIQIPTKVIVG